VTPVNTQLEYASVGVNDSGVKSYCRLKTWKYLRVSSRTAPISVIVQIALKARKTRTNWATKSIVPHTIRPRRRARL